MKCVLDTGLHSTANTVCLSNSPATRIEEARHPVIRPPNVIVKIAISLIILAYFPNTKKANAKDIKIIK
tara:strand:- start:2071 stop:2277 length:207 start_codon:yes stop_codon:yes gene_type:complete